MKIDIKKQLADIAADLGSSKTALPVPLKVKAAELIMNLMSRRQPFGLFVILGWQRKWRDFLDVSDSRQDIFARHHINILNIRPGERRRYDVGATLNFDGAILIDKGGAIIHSGVMIEGLRPRVVADKVRPGHFNDLSEQFGFDAKVHTRHLTAIAASYIFKDTTVFTVSEESGAFHIFERGQIIYRCRPPFC
jgi:hypothetical protein